MRPQTPPTQEQRERDATAADLTIGELAARTGLKPATLRMWESRHDFPRAARRDSGHRRYSEQDVELVRQVIRRRDAGLRLEMAIAEVALAQSVLADTPGTPSVYAALRRRHPRLQPQRLTKATLIALSWAIEDECCARAERPIIFGGFEKERFFRAAEERWNELARIARSTIAFAEFSQPAESTEVTLLHLPEDSPMRREWTVICDAKDYPALLTAWELPGQSDVPDRRRLFEAIWTVEPQVVRDGARACAQVAMQLGHEEATLLLYELAENPPPPSLELQNAASLLNRVVAYVDSLH